MMCEKGGTMAGLGAKIEIRKEGRGNNEWAGCQHYYNKDGNILK